MPLRESLQDLQLDQSIVTIGSFDGVHAGHKAILTQVVKEARKKNIASVVITFYPHPAVILKRITSPFYLTTPEERARLLLDMGVDEVVTLEFTQKMSELLPEEFIEELNKHLGISQLWVGHDFALGRNRMGNHDRLREIGRQMGFPVRTATAVGLNDQLISSSAIRAALANGNIKDANNMLGRPFSVTGQVVRGDGRGKIIGVPTANLAVWKEQLLPLNGIYVGRTLLEGKIIPSVSNLGIRPTFEKDDVEARLEIHLLDFHQDLYGKIIQFDFLKFLRPEKRFETVKELIDQIHLDINNTRQEFKDVTGTPGIPARPSSTQP